MEGFETSQEPEYTALEYLKAKYFSKAITIDIYNEIRNSNGFDNLTQDQIDTKIKEIIKREEDLKKQEKERQDAEQRAENAEKERIAREKEIQVIKLKKKLSPHLYWKIIFPIIISLIVILYVVLIFVYPSDSDARSIIANSVRNVKSTLNVKGNSY